MKIFKNLFYFLPHIFALSIGMVAITLFVLMSGASSTALRAGIMALLVLLSRMTSRTYDIGRGLTLAGALMILWNPFVLAYDVSFQLSFLATVAVIFFAPRIEKYFMWVTERFGLRDIVHVTVAAYVFVTPFIVYEMGNFSMVALPANILVLPFVPITMLFGFLTGFFGLVWQVIALPFGYISYWLLHYELGIIGVFANFSFASFTIAHVPLWLTLLIYAWFTYLLFGKSIKKFFTEPF